MGGILKDWDGGAFKDSERYTLNAVFCLAIG